MQLSSIRGYTCKVGSILTHMVLLHRYAMLISDGYFDYTKHASIFGNILTRIDEARGSAPYYTYLLV